MHVMLAHNSFNTFGGAEQVVAVLAEYLIKKEHKVSIVTHKCPEDLYLKFCSCEITTGNYMRLKEYVHNHYQEFDIVNAHNHPMELILWPKKQPLVWSFNEPPYYVQTGDPLNPVEKDIIEKSVSIAVVANSKNEQIYKKLYNTPVVTNMYGIDVDFYSTNSCITDKVRSLYGFTSKDYVISVVAWVHPHKRQRDALQAFIKIKKNIPNAKLLLAGTKEAFEVEYLLQMARQARVDKDVVFTGHIDRELIRDIYYSSDVILCPFQQQGGYLTVLESLCTGKPVVVSPDAMLAPELTDNKAGIVTNDYVQAVMDLYSGTIKPDYSVWKNWASQFTYERYCKSMETLFNALVSR